MSDGSFISVLDGSATAPTFFIRGKQELKTTLGGIFTLIAYIITIVALVYFSLELFFKESPSVGSAKEIYPHPGTNFLYGLVHL